MLSNLFKSGSNSLDDRLSQGSKRTVDEDIFLSSSQDVAAGKYTLIAEYKVGAQQLATIGQGTSKLDPKEQGRPFINPQDSVPETIPGMIRITHESAQGTQTQKVRQDKVAAFNQSTFSERIVMPRATSKGHSPVKEDSYIRIYLNPESANTVNQSNSEMSLPITVKE